MHLDNLLQTLNLFKQPQIISPIPKEDMVNNTGPAFKMPVANNDIYKDPTFVKTLNTIRESKPDYKGTDQQVNDLYKQYGTKLTDEINGKTTKSVLSANVEKATPVATKAPLTFSKGSQPTFNKTIPTGTDQAMKVLQSKIPDGSAPQDYFPALADKEFMSKISEADKIRPGLGNLLLLQAFHESTLGRADNGNNLFGNIVGGRPAKFPTYKDALDYQLGPNVLGGGANSNMHVTSDNTPLDTNRVRTLYKSYDPPGAYIDDLTKELTQ